MAGVSFLLGWPCLLVGFHAESRYVFLPALTLGSFFYFLCMPAVNTQIANVASPAQRATAWALAVFVLHLLGDTAAPPVFGGINDAWAPSYRAAAEERVAAEEARAGAPLDPKEREERVADMAEMMARQRVFLLFSFALLPASLCCFLASLTARADT